METLLPTQDWSLTVFSAFHRTPESGLPLTVMLLHSHGATDHVFCPPVHDQFYMSSELFLSPTSFFPLQPDHSFAPGGKKSLCSPSDLFIYGRPKHYTLFPFALPFQPSVTTSFSSGLTSTVCLFSSVLHAPPLSNSTRLPNLFLLSKVSSHTLNSNQEPQSFPSHNFPITITGTLAMASLKKVVLAASVLASYALAAPVDARALVVYTVTETDWVTLDVTSTVWVNDAEITTAADPPADPPADPTSVEAAPTTSSSISSISSISTTSTTSTISSIPTVTPSVSPAVFVGPTSDPASTSSTTPTPTPTPTPTATTTSSVAEATSSAAAAASVQSNNINASTGGTCDGEGTACVGDVTHWDGGKRIWLSLARIILTSSPRSWCVRLERRHQQRLFNCSSLCLYGHPIQR